MPKDGIGAYIYGSGTLSNLQYVSFVCTMFLLGIVLFTKGMILG